VAGCCDCGDEPSGFIKCRGVLSIAEDLLASEEELCPLELVSYDDCDFVSVRRVAFVTEDRRF
jgi:hypothetical protein